MQRAEPPRAAAAVAPALGAVGKWMALAAAFLGWMFDGLEMGLFPLVARPALRDLGVLEDARVLGWICAVNAVFLVGAAAGGVLFGWLGDRIGRVRAMVWSVLTYAIFSGLCGFSESPWHLAALRFIASLGMGGEWSLGVALVMEIWPAASRPLLAGLIGAAANIGFLLIALVGLGFSTLIAEIEEGLRALSVSEGGVRYLMGETGSGWRILLFLGAAPALLTFFIRLFVPESRRWREAARSSPKPRVSEIFAPGLRRSTILGASLGAIALLGTWGSVQLLPSWAGHLADETSRGAARSQTQIASALGAIGGTIFAALVAEWLNRRTAYFIFSALSLASCTWLFWGLDEFGGVFLAAVALVGFCTASFYGWLPLYLPELFPTRVRATGQGFAFNFGRVVAAAGTITTGTLLASTGGDYAAQGRVVTLVYVLGLFVIWLCPETKGKPLPE